MNAPIQLGKGLLIALYHFSQRYQPMGVFSTIECIFDTSFSEWVSNLFQMNADLQIRSDSDSFSVAVFVTKEIIIQIARPDLSQF